MKFKNISKWIETLNLNHSDKIIMESIIGSSKFLSLYSIINFLRTVTSQNWQEMTFNAIDGEYITILDQDWSATISDIISEGNIKLLKGILDIMKMLCYTEQFISETFLDAMQNTNRYSIPILQWIVNNGELNFNWEDIIIYPLVNAIRTTWTNCCCLHGDGYKTIYEVIELVSGKNEILKFNANIWGAVWNILLSEDPFEYAYLLSHVYEFWMHDREFWLCGKENNVSNVELFLSAHLRETNIEQLHQLILYYGDFVVIEGNYTNNDFIFKIYKIIIAQIQDTIFVIDEETDLGVDLSKEIAEFTFGVHSNNNHNNDDSNIMGCICDTCHIL